MITEAALTMVAAIEVATGDSSTNGGRRGQQQWGMSTAAALTAPASATKAATAKAAATVVATVAKAAKMAATAVAMMAATAEAMVAAKMAATAAAKGSNIGSNSEGQNWQQ